MSAGFRRQRGKRNRPQRRKADRHAAWPELFWRIHPPLLTLIIALSVASVLIGGIEGRLRPVLLTAARIQTKNTVTEVMEASILAQLEENSPQYSDLVWIERSEQGAVTAITTDMAAMNRLRVALMDALLASVSAIDEEAISIPVGTLIESELLWGRGPAIRVRSFAVGSVQAEFESEFLSAGVNQTLHKIWLELSVPMTVLLPGTQLDVAVDTRLCVAETVIVGEVPSYIQRTYG